MTIKLKLIPEKPSESTNTAILQLHTEVRAKRVIGLAAVVYYRGGNWTTLITGELKRDPHRARGMVAVLSENLGTLQREDIC